MARKTVRSKTTDKTKRNAMMRGYQKDETLDLELKGGKKMKQSKKSEMKGRWLRLK